MRFLCTMHYALSCAQFGCYKEFALCLSCALRGSYYAVLCGSCALCVAFGDTVAMPYYVVLVHCVLLLVILLLCLNMLLCMLL